MTARLRLAGAAFLGALVLTLSPPARADYGSTEGTAGTSPAGAAGASPGGLSGAQAAMQAQANYRYTYTLTSAGGQVSQIVLEYVKPDRKHELLGKVELIIIGPDAWLNAGGTWQKLPAEAAAAFTGQGATGATPTPGGPGAASTPGGPGAVAPDPLDPKTLDSSSVTLTGTDTLNGKAVDVYHVTSVSAKTTTDSTVWVGHDDHLVYKIDTTATTGGAVSHTTGTYEYNLPNLDIQPPKLP